jgi:hypothetical protein
MYPFLIDDPLTFENATKLFVIFPKRRERRRKTSNVISKPSENNTSATAKSNSKSGNDPLYKIVVPLATSDKKSMSEHLKVVTVGIAISVVSILGAPARLREN